MKELLIVLLLSAICFPLSAKNSRVPQEKDMKAYLMVFHKDATHSLYMAISYDGYTFKALNNGQPVLAGDTIAQQKGIRDPHIFRGPDGAFYLSMTDLNIYAQRDGYRKTEWERDGRSYGWGNNRALVLMKSFDLIHWNRANIRFDKLDPSLSDVGCVWAPETVFDDKTGRLMIYYTMRHGNGMNVLCYSYVNSDYNKIETLPKVLFTYPKPNISAIDGDITNVNGKYHLFYCSHDGTAGIKQAVSDTINCGYKYNDVYYDYEKGGCEAPNVWKRIGEKKWVLMYDIYSIKPHNFGFAETSDFVSFKNLGHFDEGVMKRTNFSEQKHGAVVWLTKKEAKTLENYWKKNQRDFIKK